MKTFMKRSMALLLTVLMLLSCVVTGTIAFTASAEEVPETDASTPEVSLYRQNGTFIAEGSLVEMNELAKKDYPDANLVCKFNKDIELDAPITFQSKRIVIFDGQGHTIYFSKTLLEDTEVSSFINFYDFKGVDTFSITFKNLNFSGQPMDWDGKKTTATYYGTVGADAGAIAIHKNVKLTFDNCRLENFYANARGACFYFTGVNATTDQEETLANRGLWLKDTVITNNYSANTGAANATVIRTRFGNVGSQVHVSGSTYIDNNYDADGKPFANIYVSKGAGAATYASSVLHVESDFTGAVATNGAASVAPSKDSETGEVTMVGTVYFDGAYDPTDGGFVYAWRGAGNTNKDLIVPVDATKASEAQRVQATGGNLFYYLDSTKTWTNAGARAAFEALNATKDASGTYTTETRLAAAAKNVVVLTADVVIDYNNKQLSGMYTVWGNGHELRSAVPTQVGGLPMLRFGDSNANTTVIFNDIIMNGDVKATEGDDGFLKFDKISTEEVETAQGAIGAGDGAALGSYYAGQYFALNNVEIKNFVQTRCNWAPADDARRGAAIHDNAGAEWHFNNVNFHDNYTGKNGSVVYAKSTNTKLYFSGDIQLENNYMTEFVANSGDAENFKGLDQNFKLIREADVWINTYKNLYFEESAVADSVIMGNCCSANLAFACIAEDAIENVNLVNSLSANFTPYVDEASAIEGYTVLRWQDPDNIPEEVTFKIYARDNTTVVIDDLTRTLVGGDNLPALTGIIWYNGETVVTTHTKGVTTYEGKWADDAVATILVSTDNRKTWTYATNLDAVTYTETPATDIELLQGYEFDKARGIPKNAIFTLDGNGFTNTIKSGATFAYIFQGTANTDEELTKTFKNFVLDGTGWTKIGSGTGVIYIVNDSGKWVFDNCTFKNCVGADQAGVFRPTGNVTVVLKDVLMENCGGTQGSIRTGFSGDLGPVIILAGNTTINDGTADGVNAGTNGKYNRIYFNTVGAIAVSEDFTGDVDIFGNGLSNVDGLAWTAVDRVLASVNFVNSATVAEGAEITGKIWNLNQAGLFAYDNNGSLCWGNAESLTKISYTFDVKGGFAVIEDGKYDVGTELPMPKKADFSGETPKFWVSEWYYDNAEGVATKTTVTVAGFTHYYVGEYVEDDSIEAYVDENNYGSLKEVVADSAVNDRIEFAKDIYLSEKITLPRDLTLDGNGYKLSFELDENGKAIIRDYLVSVGNNRNILFTDIVFDGRGTPGVWGQDIQEANKGFVAIGTADIKNDAYGITYNDCTFQGLRVYSISESFSMISVNGYRTTFTGNTLITDNMFRAAQYVYDADAAKLTFPKDEDGNYIPATTDNCTKISSTDPLNGAPTNKMGAVIRGDGSTIVYIKDNAQIYDNFGIYQTMEEGATEYTDVLVVANCNVTSGGSTSNPGYKRVVIGPLAETAKVYTNFGQGYMVALDENGKAYNLGNGVYAYDATTAEWWNYNTVVSAHNPNAEDVDADLAYHTSNGGDVVAIARTIKAGQLVIGSSSGMQVGGNLASDRFTLDVYLTIRANVGETLTVSIGDAVISSKTVAEYGLPISRRLTVSDTYGWYKVSVDVGMAQLTDTIKFELTDKDGTKLGSTYTMTVKSYIDGLLASEETAAALKDALAALLQYGAMAQVQFAHNTEKLANDGDYSAYNYTKVEEKELTFADPAQVKATKTGTLEGISVLGSTLVLNNQISLRIYVSTEDATAYTFTIGGKACELQTGKNGTYIEIANIGTADLAEFVTLTIAPVAGEGSIVYTVSPMSYVYAVNGSASQPESLKNVCEAMFYYFDAVMTAYDYEHGITFTTEAVLNVSLDEANAYSVPYGIVG